MKHIIFAEPQQDKYKVAVLIKDTAMSFREIHKQYIEPLELPGFTDLDYIALSLKYNEKNKAPVKLMKLHLVTILKAVRHLGITTLVCADASYFKQLAKVTKTTPYYGYIVPCGIPGYEDINIVLTVNYQALFHDPKLTLQLDLSLDALRAHLGGTVNTLGHDVIRSAIYPSGLAAVAQFLDSLHSYPMLTCDIEAYSLEFNEARIGTIGFAWDKHNGGAFLVDEGSYSAEVRELLIKFFLTYKGTLVYHNANYDVKILIYELFMDSLLDTTGLLTGIEVMCRDIVCTKIVTYIATNSTSGNVLSLKPNSVEFMGNYAEEDIHDITLIPHDKLLEYNLKDCLATWFVYDKYFPIIVDEQLISVYQDIFMESVPVVINMELTGMPMEYRKVQELANELTTIMTTQVAKLHEYPTIRKFLWSEQQLAMRTANAKLKKKIRPISEFKVELNPGSDPQMRKLLYEFLGLPVIDLTKTKMPATGQKTLNKILNRLTNEYSITEKELE